MEQTKKALRSKYSEMRSAQSFMRISRRTLAGGSHAVSTNRICHTADAGTLD
jgi:hypothetical protein